jgi:cytochrome P450
MAAEQTSDAVAVDYDLHDSSLAEHPFDLWRSFRDRGRILKSNGNGGFFIVSRYDDIYEAEHATDLFCSGQGVAIPPLPYPLMPPIEYDAPMHGRYRRILSPWFSPVAAEGREAEIRLIAVDLLQAVEGAERFDLCASFAHVLPQRATLRLLGIDDEYRERIAGWVETILRLRGIDDAKVAQAGAEMTGWIANLIEERRNHLADDLLSAMVTATIDGRPLVPQELIMMTVLLLNAGLDTTAAAISVSAWYLAQHPEVQARLRAEPDLMESAVEEFIRWISPVPFEGRTVTQDLEFKGCPMRRGEKIALLLGSGNRDPEQFPDPDEVILDRHPNRHMAFGVGPHRCLGSHIARVILRVALQEMLARLGEWRIADPEGLVWATCETRGLRAFPIAPGSAPSAAPR